PAPEVPSGTAPLRAGSCTRRRRAGSASEVPALRPTRLRRRWRTALRPRWPQVLLLARGISDDLRTTDGGSSWQPLFPKEGTFARSRLIRPAVVLVNSKICRYR